MQDAVLAQTTAHLNAGRFEQALQVVRRALDRDPLNAKYLEKTVEVLSVLKRHDQGLFLIQRAVAKNPFDANLFRLCAGVEVHRKRYAEAETHFRRALALDPTNFGTMASIANMLYMQGRMDESRAYARHVYEKFPHDTRAVQMYSGYAEMLGDLDEAVRVLRATLDHSPGNQIALQMLMIPLARVHGMDPKIIFDYHVRLGNLLTSEMSVLAGPHPNNPDPERPLRIGYCSQDFRNRSVGHFFEPIMTHHDRSQFEVVLYHDMLSEDELTARLRSRARLYVATQHMKAKEFIEHVRSRQIDIMVDLSGYTGSRHTCCFAAKPAPVQYTYLGYPNTTAIPAMDYRIVDAYTDPPGSEHLATEQLVRMEGSFLCYTPPAHAGPVAPPPRRANGFVTFGSFNTITKVGNPVLEIWARILREVPGSRLVLKALGLASAMTQERIVNFFTGLGIARERYDLLEETKEKADHLAAYSKMDIALDTWPYNGTTTTVEAMYMGVPVIGIAGNSHVSRVGVSILSNLGLADLVATDEDDYVRKAAQLASDGNRCEELRSRLRQTVLDSPLCDHAGFTRRLEAHYRASWRKWCERVRR